MNNLLNVVHYVTGVCLLWMATKPEYLIVTENHAVLQGIEKIKCCIKTLNNCIHIQGNKTVLISAN